MYHETTWHVTIANFCCCFFSTLVVVLFLQFFMYSFSHRNVPGTQPSYIYLFFRYSLVEITNRLNHRMNLHFAYSIPQNMVYIHLVSHNPARYLQKEWGTEKKESEKEENRIFKLCCCCFFCSIKFSLATKQTKVKMKKKKIHSSTSNPIVMFSSF